MSCLLIIGLHRKKIVFDNSSNAITLSQLKTQLKNSKQIAQLIPNFDSAIYQMYDRDYDEFIDIEGTSIIGDKSKVKVINLKSSEIILEEISNPGPSAEVSSHDDSTSNCSFFVDGRPNSLTSNNVHNVVTLPTFSAHLKPILEGHQPLTNAARDVIIEQIFQTTIGKVIYPGRLYEVICSSLIITYPALRDVIGSGFDSWTGQLKDKFKNERRKIKNNNEINGMRKKFKVGTEVRQTKQIHTAPVSQVRIDRCQNVSQNKSLNLEDDDSINAHIEAMQNEANKLRPDPAIIQDRMERTFSRRIEMAKKSSVQDVLQTYPFFGDSVELLKDFKHKTGFDLNKSVVESLEAIDLSLLLQLFTPRQIKQVTEAYDNFLGDDSVRDEATKLSLLTILLREKPSNFVTVKEDTAQANLTPIILQHGDDLFSGGKIYCEGVEVCSCKTFVEGLTILFAMYWIFNIKYAKNVSKSMVLFEYIFLNRKPKKSGSGIVRAIAQLNNCKVNK